jgi:predicted NBD/HSP70 family sugar kinase
VTLNDRHVTLAIDLRPGKANLAVVDINGKILGRQTTVFEAQHGSKEEAGAAIAQIAHAARSLKAAYGDRVFQGSGMSVSGRVDQRTHRLVFSPNVPWSQINLYAELEKVLETPIEMENAANACLFSERWFGNFGNASNMIAISVSEGIGAGLLVDGRVVRGNNDLAGEFGHMPLEESGPVRQRGMLGDIRLKPGRASVLQGACAGKRAHLVSGVARSGSWGRHPSLALDRQDDELPRPRTDHVGSRPGS